MTLMGSIKGEIYWNNLPAFVYTVIRMEQIRNFSSSNTYIWKGKQNNDGSTK